MRRPVLKECRQLEECAFIHPESKPSKLDVEAGSHRSRKATAAALHFAVDTRPIKGETASPQSNDVTPGAT